MNTKYILLLVVLASTMGQTATDIYIPSLPNLAKIFDSSSDLIKTTVTIVYFGYAIMQFICGPLSDRLGRKYFMVMGIGIFATSTLMASYCETVTDLLMIRLIQGIGIGSFGIANRAILFDTFHGNEYVRAISIVGITMTCASLITPAIGACIFDYFGWRANFNIMFVYAIILLTAVLLFLPETHKPQQSLNYAENNSESKTGIFSYFVNNYKIIFCSSHFWTYGLINTLGFSAFLFYLSTAPFIFHEQLDIGSVKYGWIICFLALGYIAGSVSGNKLVKYYNRNTVIVIGNYCQLLGGLAMILLNILDIISATAVLAPMIIFVYGNGLINPSATSLLLNNFPKLAASAAAAMGFIITLGASALNSLLFFLSTDSTLQLGEVLFTIALCSKSVLYIAFEKSIEKEFATPPS